MFRKQSTNCRSVTILKIVNQIPRGKIATYGGIAKVCGLINQARIVGYVLNRLPTGTDVPWYRVINTKGKISFEKNTTEYKQQKKLLEKEGIVFKDGRVDRCRYDWLRSEKFT
ncbi:MAG: MGMT family protein [Bacteroidota bacterium]|nr:MGMT family protein [Bacteroidota bacterium]